MANPNGVPDSTAADAAWIPYVGHPGTGLERPAYSQAPRCGGETGVCVPNKYHLSRKRLFHGRDLTTAGISIRVVVSADRKCPNSRAPRFIEGLHYLDPGIIFWASISNKLVSLLCFWGRVRPSPSPAPHPGLLSPLGVRASRVRVTIV